MSSRSLALFDMILVDVSEYLPFGPVALGDLPPDASYKQVASAALVQSIIKKLIPSDPTAADTLAKEKFLASNKKCKDWSLRSERLKDDYLLGEFRKEVYHFFHSPNGDFIVDSYSSLLELGKTGPGSAIGAYGQSMYAKLWASPLTATSKGLYDMYRAWCRMYPEFSNAEAIRQENHGSVRLCDHSRTSLVPKTSKVSRMICTEPSLNMYYQLGMGKVIEHRLLQIYGIDLSSQPLYNQRLAKLGSVSGQYSTIDLESASDSISLNLLKWALPEYIYNILCDIRSPRTMLDGSLVELEMMSTMGNGFTFPLQTALFSCLIRAAYRVSGIPIFDRDSANWACFGDDLIVDAKAYNSVDRLLGLLGFTINQSKSFYEGGFRESCGTDWFYGRSVRGVYVKKLDSSKDILVTINLLNDWSSKTGIGLYESVQYLIKLLPVKMKNLYVPFNENIDSGIRVPSSLLQLPKYDHNNSIIYRVLRPIPKKVRIGDGVIHSPRGVKKLIYNPSGLHLSFLYGEIRDCAWHVRNDIVRYRSRLRVTPFWDYVPCEYSQNDSEFRWRRWESAVELNLNN